MNEYQESLDNLWEGAWGSYSKEYDLLQELVDKATPQETGIRYSVINPEWTAEVCGECEYLISKDDVYCPMCGQKIGWRVEDE